MKKDIMTRRNPRLFIAVEIPDSFPFLLRYHVIGFLDLEKPKDSKTYLFPALAVCATVILTGLSKPVDVALRKEATEVIRTHPTEGETNRKKQTLESLGDYRANAIKLQKNLSKIKTKDVRTTVTFNEPLQTNDAVELIEKYEVKPDLIYLYGEENGQDGYVTTGVFIKDGYSAEKIKEALVEATNELGQNNARPIGILSVVGSVPHEEVVSVQNEPKVYLADISADSGFGENQTGRDYVQHLGYDLYELKRKK